MLAECLARLPAAHAAWMKDGEWASLGEAAAAAVLVGLLAAILVAPLLQRAYSRRMLRFMAMREVADAPVRWWRPTDRLGPARPARSAQEPMSLAAAAAQREQRVRRASWAAYAAFVAGGLVTLVLQPSANDRWLAAAYVVLLGLGPARINVQPQGRSVWLWLPAVAMGVLALAIGTMGPGEAVIAVVAILLVAVAGVHRTLRAVVGPSMPVLAGALAGLLAAAWAGEALLPACAPGAASVAPGSLGQLATLAAGAAVVVAGVALGLAVLPLARRAIEGGWLSDLSLVSLFGAVFVAVLLIVGSDGPVRSPWLGFGLFCGWIGVTVAAYAWALSRQPCPTTARTLLVLRVFSHDGRTERMLDSLQTRWRYAGPVVQIGGPDLAALNLDLGEFIAFLTLRQHELLVSSHIDEAAFVDALDLEMDREGRFRIDEVFCFDSSWKTMVERLMRVSDAILLDLRGFTPQRGGTTHEVLRLAALGLLPRCVALTDEHTDAQHFAAQIGGQRPAASVQSDAPDALERCWAGLLAAADTPGRGGPPPAP